MIAHTCMADIRRLYQMLNDDSRFTIRRCCYRLVSTLLGKGGVPPIIPQSFEIFVHDTAMTLVRSSLKQQYMSAVIYSLSGHYSVNNE